MNYLSVAELQDAQLRNQTPHSSMNSNFIGVLHDHTPTICDLILYDMIFLYVVFHITDILSLDV